jgi:hypothetical protein
MTADKSAIIVTGYGQADITKA